MRRFIALSLAVVGCSQQVPLASAPESRPSALVAAADSPAVVAVPEPTNPNALWVGAASGNDAFMPGAQESFLAVWVDVPNAVATKQAPAAVALVIDTSGSMAQGNKIQHAREAAIRLVSSMRDGDIVSLHSFSDEVRERVAPTRLDAHSRQRIAGIIAELSAVGGTNLFEGVRAAGFAAMSSPSTHSVRRVVLLSDGNATVGTTSTEMIGMLGERAADRGVQVTSIGVGLDYNENALNQLALRSSGRLYHVTDSSGLGEVVESELALLKSTRASDARVAIVPAPGVQLTSVSGARFVSGSNGSFEIPLGAMFAGQHREFLVRARFNAPVEGPASLASVRLVFSDPNDGNLERVQETVARYDVTSDANVFAARKNARAQGVMAMLLASESTRAASIAFDQEDFSGADKRLAEAEESLRQLAASAGSKEEKVRFQKSAERVASTRGAGAAAAQAPAAARPAAKRKMSLETNDAAMDFSGF